MLRKLLKYDWKSFWKVPAAINLFLLIITLIGVISLVSPFWNMDSDFMEYLMVMSVFFYSLSIFACGIAVSVYIAVRFYKNMYTDEGYLTHTLPVTPRQIIISKMLVSAAWSAITYIVTVASIILILFAGLGATGDGLAEFINEFLKVWKLMESETGISLSSMFLYLLIYMVLNTFCSILMMYSSITLGQLFSRHKVAGAVLWYIAEYVIVQIGTSLIFNLPITINLVLSDVNRIMAGIRILMLVLLILTFILSIVLYFVTEYMMKKRLNLD